MAIVTFTAEMPEGQRLRDLFVEPSTIATYNSAAISATFEVTVLSKAVTVTYGGFDLQSNSFQVATVDFGDETSKIWLSYDTSDLPKDVLGSLTGFHEGSDGTAAFLMRDADRVTGSWRGDFLESYAGNDTLDGGVAGSDTMVGGAGDDTYFVDNTQDRTIEAAGGGYDVVLTSVGFALAYSDEVEELHASGAFAIALTGSGTRNFIVGSAGNDTLDGAGGTDTLSGGAGDDTYIVNSSSDILVEDAAAGYDTVLTRTDYAMSTNLEVLKAIAGSSALWLTGNALNNLIVGNASVNNIQGLDGNDDLYGDGGNDWIDGGAGADVIYAGMGNDSVFGGSENDTLYGDVGADYFSGGAGDDVLFGGADNDTMLGDDGNDLVYGDVGNDRLYGGAGYDKLFGGLGKNTLDGGAGNDILYGGMHAEKLLGDLGKDKLYGDAGNDTINGGLENDTLSGGQGNDTFVFTTKLNKTKNVDRIVDFSVVNDRFQLDDLVFKKIGPRGALNADAFHTGSSAQDASDHVIYNAGNGSLYYDADGTGASAQIRFAILKPGLQLSAADFFVI